MKEYMQKHRGHAAAFGILVFLLHGAKLNSNILGIDSEALIRLQDGFYYSWFVTGRQGRVLLKYLLGNSVLHPYFNAVLALFMFVLCTFAFFALWDKVWGRDERKAGMGPWIWGGLLWISHPIMTEQLYFSLQSVEVLCSFLLTAAALYLSGQWVRRLEEGFSKKALLYFAAAVALLILTFSNYQVFVAIYIFGVVSLLVLQGYGELAAGKTESARRLFTRTGGYLLIFLTAFGINTVITNLFFSSSDYIQNQVLWSSHRFVDCLRNICGHVFRTVTGWGSIFYSLTYGLLCIVSLILAICMLKRFCRSKGTGAVLLFFWLSLQTTPFLMSLFLGGAPVVRSQLVLPIMTGFLAYMDFRFLELLWPQHVQDGKRKRIPAAWAGLVLLCLAGGMEQARTTGALYYTDCCRYEQDEAVGYALIDRIRQVNWQGDELPVVVIGRREFEKNNSCIVGEVMGKSFFDYDMEADPTQFWSTWRVLGFLHTLGADFPQLPAERIPEAMEYSTFMPSWPAENSVQIQNGMIIVKLSHYE